MKPGQAETLLRKSMINGNVSTSSRILSVDKSEELTESLIESTKRPGPNLTSRASFLESSIKERRDHPAHLQSAKSGTRWKRNPDRELAKEMPLKIHVAKAQRMLLSKLRETATRE
jgi:hypothetical protein